jgi:flavin reductase (DIM6/NTAB) family NADH-FMN oxidoreductase RutF
MNLSSAPIDRDDSEFELGHLTAEAGTHVAAPLVQGTKVQLECDYVKTVDVGSFSVIIGKVVSTKVAKSVLKDDGVIIDGTKLKAVTRLGYTDEYAVIDQAVN